ncbi:MAG: TonB-dependent receptor [Bacteroidota bacterium]|nr:TonB-dependent receptor [Bacteroidota bacterium]
MEREILSTNRKALRLNLDDSVYGTFAEIGGGQEASRNFFTAGGASGTIAKTVSAYDKKFSDRFYNNNKPGRYVSEGRLTKMVKTEFDELVNVLEKENVHNRRYFAFANTVATINYKKDNFSHGWLGIRFQLEADSDPNQVVMHVNLHENDAVLQQQSLGVLGVNFIFACFHFHDRPNVFLQSLLDGLDRDRVEITLIRMSGPDLSYVDNRLLSVQLVNNGMTNATMFDRNGNVQQASDMLYKKNVLAFRGSFRPITYVGFDMLKTSFGMFKKDDDYEKDNTISLCEMTLNNLLEEGEFDERDFLDRADMLIGMGQNVMVSNYREYYKLVTYFSQFKIKNLRVVIGIPTFLNVLDQRYYTQLKGGILEAFGKLFTNNMKLYVYPTKDHESGELITSHNIPLDDELEHLYKYLIQNRKIIDLEGVNTDKLHIKSKEVLSIIKNNEKGWEKLVPVYIEEFIKTNKLFGFQGKQELVKRAEDCDHIMGERTRLAKKKRKE